MAVYTYTRTAGIQYIELDGTTTIIRMFVEVYQLARAAGAACETQ